MRRACAGRLRAGLLLLVAGVAACSDLASDETPIDAGALAPDTGIHEPPDPAGPSPWIRRTPQAAPSPTARFGHALAFDPVRGKVVLFGGYGGRALRDLWEWDGEAGTWTNRTPAALPATWPAPRLKHALVWDPARQRIVLYGGDSARGLWLGDLWEWNGDDGSWLNRTPAPIPAGTWPQPRWGHGLAADETRGKLVMFGGAYSSVESGAQGTPFGDTWEWGGEQGSWTERRPAQPAVDQPSARRGHGMTWDTRRQRVVMLMGASIGSDALYDPTVWQWEGDLGVWRRVGAVMTGPVAPGREDQAVAFDGGRGRLVLFGGWRPPTLGDAVLAQTERDLWELDASSGSWSERTVLLGQVAWPLGRARHSMVHDGKRQRVVLFGGSTSGGLMADTWEWTGIAQ